MPFPSQRVILFPGSFDPVHNGHVSVAKQALAETAFDAVWFLPSPQNPFKTKKPMWSFEERLAMLRLALAAEPAMRACGVEAGLPAPHHTHRVVEVLEAQHPRVVFALLIGEDLLPELPLWKQHKNLVRNKTLLVHRRGTTARAVPEALEKKIKWLSGRAWNGSSSEVRRLVREGRTEALKPLLNPKVLAYMTARGD